MHFKKITLLAAVVVASLSYSAQAVEKYTIKPPERSAIEQHKRVIARELRYNSLQRYALISVGTVAGTLALYKMFGHHLPQEGIVTSMNEKLSGIASAFNPANWLKKSKSAPIKAQPETPQAIDPCGTPEQCTKTVAQNMPAVKKVAQYYSINMFSLAWWKSLGEQLTRGLCLACAKKALWDPAQNTVERVFHPGTLRWYVTNHTQWPELLDEISLHTTALATKGSASDYKVDYYKNAIAWASNNLVQQVGQVIAFMEYKVERIPDAVGGLKKEAQGVIQYIIYATQTFCQQVEAALTTPDAVRSGSDLATAMQEFKTDLARSIVRFNNVSVLAECVEIN